MTARAMRTPSKAVLRRTMDLLAERGLSVTGARVCPDGAVVLLTGDQGVIPPADELDAELEAWAAGNGQH